MLLTLSAGCHFWNPFTSGGGITITWNDIQYGILIAINLVYITRNFGEDNCKTAPIGLPIARAPDKRKDIFLDLLSTSLLLVTTSYVNMEEWLGIGQGPTPTRMDVNPLILRRLLARPLPSL